MPLAARQKPTNATRVCSERVALVEHPGGGRRGEHEHVLGPLLRPGGADRRLQHRGPTRSRGVAVRGRAGRIGGRGHRAQAIGPCRSRSTRCRARRTRGRHPVVDSGGHGSEDLHAQGRRRQHRSPLRRTGRQGLRRARRVRRGRRGGLGARPRPRRGRSRLASSTSCSCGCSASCSWSAPSSRPRPRTARSWSRACRSRPRRWSPHSNRSSTTSPPATRRPTEFVLPGENRTAAALDVARAVVRRAERARSRPPATAGSADSQVVPYLNRLADLVYTLARWQEGTFRPVRADLAPEHTHSRSPIPTTPEHTVSLAFTVATTPADRRRGRAARRAHREGRAPSAPGADVGRRRARRRSRRVPRGGGLRGQARRDAGGTDRRAAAGQGRRSSSASAIPPSSPSTALPTRRAAAVARRQRARPRRSPPPSRRPRSALDSADAAQAVAEGFVLGAYQYLEYKGDAAPTKLKKVT